MARRPAETRPLRLLALEPEDLPVMSAALQDAVCKVGDIRYEPALRRLTLAVNRYRWERGERRPERIRSALQFGGVLEVKARRLRREAKDAVLSLLALEFEPSGGVEDPGGTVHLRFSGHGDLRLRVEAIDLVLADVSGPWPAVDQPRHDLDAR